MLPYNDQFSFDGVPFSPSNFLNANNPDSPMGEQVVPQSNAGEPHFADTAFYRNLQNGPDASPQDGCFIADSSCMSFNDLIVSPRDGSLITVGSAANFGDPFARCLPESSSSGQEFLNLPSSSDQEFPASSGQEFNSPSSSLPEFDAASFQAYLNPPASTGGEFLNPRASTGGEFLNPPASTGGEFLNPPASTGGEFLNPPASTGGEFLNSPASTGGEFLNPPASTGGEFLNPPASTGGEFLNPPASTGGEFLNPPASTGEEFNSPVSSSQEFFNVPASSGQEFFNVPASSGQEFFNVPASSGQEFFNVPASSGQEFFNVPASSGQEFFNVPASSGQEFLNIPYSNCQFYFSNDQQSSPSVDSSNLSFAVASCSQMSVASSSSQRCSVAPYSSEQCSITSSNDQKPIVSSSNQWFVSSSNSRRSPVSSPSSQESSASSPSSQETSIADCTTENPWNLDFDYSKITLNELESLNLDVFDNVNGSDSDQPDHNEYTTHSRQSPNKNYPFIGKESDVTLTELNVIDFPTKASMKASIDLEDEIKGQIFLPMATHNRFLDPMVKKGRELYRMSASTYTPDFDHCYIKRETEEFVIQQDYREIKIKKEPKEIKIKESKEPKITNRSLRLRIKREPKVKIKEESMDEESDSDSSSDSSDGDYVNTRPCIPRRPIRTAAVGTVSESEYRAQCHTRKRTDRPIVKPKRFSQRENTPPVRQYKRTCTKKETTMVATALLKQMKPNQRNTKLPAKRGRKPANSLSSSVNSSRAGSEMDEPNPKREPDPKRAEHNTLERNRRNLQRNYLHDMRDAMPHFRHDLKASKVKIIFAASAYIKVIEDEHDQLAEHLHQLQKQNAFLKRRRDFLLNC